jgi:hypothetical protein
MVVFMKNHENTIDLKTRTVYPDASRAILALIYQICPFFALVFAKS